MARIRTTPCSNPECRISRDVGDFASPSANLCRPCKKDYNARRAAAIDALGDRFCTKCGVFTVAAGFDKGKDYCKTCNRSNSRAWYLNNTERHAALSKAWHSNNPERAAETGKAWHSDNRERTAANGKAWRAANPDKRAAIAARRRAAKAGVYHEDWSHVEIFTRDGWVCQDPHCRIQCIPGDDQFAPDYPHADHVKPLQPSDGSPGGHDAPYNLQLLCGYHNLSKKNRWPLPPHTARDGDASHLGGADPDAGCPDCYEDDLEAARPVCIR